MIIANTCPACGSSDIDREMYPVVSTCFSCGVILSSESWDAWTQANIQVVVFNGFKNVVRKFLEATPSNEPESPFRMYLDVIKDTLASE